jgi:hypothetical protein
MNRKRQVLFAMILSLLLAGTACGKSEVESTILTESPAETVPVTTQAVPTTQLAETEPETEPLTEPTEPSTDSVDETTELAEETTVPEESTTGNQRDYVLNTNSKKFHYSDCSSVNQMKESNCADFHGTREEVIAKGYDPCGRCKP